MKSILMTGCLLLAFIQSSWLQAEEHRIVLGGKNFTEQFLLARITSLILQERGFVVEEELNLSTIEIRQAILDQKIDLYWEYTGTAYSAIHRLSDPEVIADAEKLYTAVKGLDEERGLIWLDKASLNNTYSLVVPAKLAETHRLASISDLGVLAQIDSSLTMGADGVFIRRPDGLRQMLQHYGFSFGPGNIIELQGNRPAYSLLQRGRLQVGMAFATDPQIYAHDLVVLEDDLGFFPVYNPAPVIRREVLERHPELESLLNSLPGFLNDKEMIQLNYAVDIDNKSVDQVAREWLIGKGLISDTQSVSEMPEAG
ncbi:glycine betaine ABC transporter substrate-binding protein [Nitrincola sp. MINF-07-Sa-05]|uniref:glycine betaine ABC transporter substrate-binding protein n=1 Tax=Nitrincola salilacus TaxID=3400273 RepID=UPI003917ED43